LKFLEGVDGHHQSAAGNRWRGQSIVGIPLVTLEELAWNNVKFERRVRNSSSTELCPPT
jgi:hypothetical protein